MFRIAGFFCKSVFSRIVQVRFVHRVKHNARRNIFYVRLEDDDSAVLLYKADGKVLDMQSINVPEQHQGRGLARLLGEAAFTYAIVNDYYMILTCEYMQKLYRATQSVELEERVIGPKHILEGGTSERESIHDLPEPEDFKRER